jgi:LAO/AO transport system kinase
LTDRVDALYEKLLAGDRRAAARLISMVENGDEGAREVLRRLHKHSGKAHIIGLTGSPGSGKSTLACRLAQEYRSEGLSVGIICVDPTRGAPG